MGDECKELLCLCTDMYNGNGIYMPPWTSARHTLGLGRKQCYPLVSNF